MMTDAAKGAFLGLACGDALGRPVEFKTPRQIRSRHNGTLEKMVGNGTHSQPRGTISDDTEQALAIARSLDECGVFDPSDIANRFVDWYRSGPFDIGLTTSASLRLLADGVPWDKAGKQALEERGPGSGAGNGSVMRCAPVAIAYADASTERLAEVSRVSSIITHADSRCTDGAAALNIIISAHLNDAHDPLERGINWLSDNYDDTSEELLERLKQVQETPRDTADLPNGGYVVDTMETALTVAHRADSVDEAIIETVNLGGDADTTGAVAGAVAGARFGVEELRDDWIDAIEEGDEIRRLATNLYTTNYE